MKFVFFIWVLLESQIPVFAQVNQDSVGLKKQTGETQNELLKLLIAEQKRARQEQDSLRDEVLKKWKPGTPCPDFTFSDINGKMVSLKSLRGNYVYIDVWATWCGPCCKEIPFLQKLEEAWCGKKIAFVSISSDKKREDWEKMVKEKNLKGLQLHLGKDRRFMNEFAIIFIPRFILLDPKGSVVDAFMTRPSDPKTEETFNTLKGI